MKFKPTLSRFTITLLVILTSCAAFNRGTESSVVGLREAHVAAVSWMFDKTMRLQETRLGLIAFEGIEPFILRRLREKYGDLLPELTIDLQRVDQNAYIDSRTKRDAMIVRIETRLVGAKRIILRISKYYGDLGGSEYHCTLEKLGDTWQVTQWELGGVS